MASRRLCSREAHWKINLCWLLIVHLVCITEKWKNYAWLEEEDKEKKEEEKAGEKEEEDYDENEEETEGMSVWLDSSDSSSKRGRQGLDHRDLGRI